MKASRRISVCVSSRENAYVDDDDSYEDDEDYENYEEYDWAIEMEKRRRGSEPLQMLRKPDT
jgi:hypothetical protein